MRCKVETMEWPTIHGIAYFPWMAGIHQWDATYTLAPEANGSWDAKEARTGPSHQGEPDSAKPKLVYERYCDPDRENLAWGLPNRNVFPHWRVFHPQALEAAEVFSLGRTM